jgi:hypothetical protein
MLHVTLFYLFFSFFFFFLYKSNEGCFTQYKIYNKNKINNKKDPLFALSFV